MYICLGCEFCRRMSNSISWSLLMEIFINNFLPPPKKKINKWITPPPKKKTPRKIQLLIKKMFDYKYMNALSYKRRNWGGGYTCILMRKLVRKIIGTSARWLKENRATWDEPHLHIHVVTISNLFSFDFIQNR